MMQNMGKVIGFSTYTPEQVEKMRKALQLSLSHEQLRYCASYYQGNAKRDPFIDELRMLDRIANHASVPMLATAPIELVTEDAALAQTYADLMSKRRTLYPTKRTPCAFGEIFTILNEALRRAGKVPLTKNAVTLWSTADQQVLSNEATPSICSPNGRFRLTEHTVLHTDAAKNDFWAILLPFGARSHAEKKDADARLIKDCAGYIKQTVTVQSAGLMEVLLQVADGLWIDLSYLSQAGEEVPLSVMTDFYEGHHLIRMSGENVNRAMQAAKELSLRIQPFAMVMSDSRFVFANKKEELFSLETAFLRSLPRLRTVSLTLADGGGVTPSPIAHAPLSAAVCAYLSHSDEVVSEDVLQIEGTLHATASASADAGVFGTAMRTVLAPLLSLAASGCDLNTKRLSACIELPQEITDEKAVGEAFSLALGVYRVLAELALPLCATRVVCSQAAKKAELTVFASADGEDTVPSRFTGDGNRIYCIAPDTRRDGTYDIKSFRNLQSYLCDLRKKGVLVSARVLCGEPVTEGLALMSTSKTAYRITRQSIAAEEALPLAILIEACAPIEARQVGVTVSAKRTEEALPSLPLMQSMIWSERPQITLLASGNDCHAAILRAYLEEKGADVYLFSDKAAQTDALARSLLGSQYLILCGQSIHRPSERLKFALGTLIRSGGKILSVKENSTIGEYPVISYPTGLPASVIGQICSSSDKL